MLYTRHILLHRSNYLYSITNHVTDVTCNWNNIKVDSLTRFFRLDRMDGAFGCLCALTGYNGTREHPIRYLFDSKAPHNTESLRVNREVYLNLTANPDFTGRQFLKHYTRANAGRKRDMLILS